MSNANANGQVLNGSSMLLAIPVLAFTTIGVVLVLNVDPADLTEQIFGYLAYILPIFAAFAAGLALLERGSNKALTKATRRHFLESIIFLLVGAICQAAAQSHANKWMVLGTVISTFILLLIHLGCEAKRLKDIAGIYGQSHWIFFWICTFVCTSVSIVLILAVVHGTFLSRPPASKKITCTDITVNSLSKSSGTVKSSSLTEKRIFQCESEA